MERASVNLRIGMRRPASVAACPTTTALLRDVLAGDGLDLSGWTLTRASAISDDGRTIAGAGRHNGFDKGSVARLGGDGCAADMTGDGFDLLAYLVGWFGGC